MGTRTREEVAPAGHERSAGHGGDRLGLGWAGGSGKGEVQGSEGTGSLRGEAKELPVNGHESSQNLNVLVSSKLPVSRDIRFNKDHGTLIT